jgi:hypothetical protein
MGAFATAALDCGEGTSVRLAVRWTIRLGFCFVNGLGAPCTSTKEASISGGEPAEDVLASGRSLDIDRCLPTIGPVVSEALCPSFLGDAALTGRIVIGWRSVVPPTEICFLTFVPEKSQAVGSTADLALALGEELAPNPEAGNRLELRNIFSLWCTSVLLSFNESFGSFPFESSHGRREGERGEERWNRQSAGKKTLKENKTFSASM